jgi:hypothetical protein
VIAERERARAETRSTLCRLAIRVYTHVGEVLAEASFHKSSGAKVQGLARGLKSFMDGRCQHNLCHIAILSWPYLRFLVWLACLLRCTERG